MEITEVELSPVESATDMQHVKRTLETKKLSPLQLYKQWKESLIYNPITLIFKDPEKNLQFRFVKYDNMLLPLIINCVVDGVFALYMIYLDHIGSKLWAAPTGSETKEEKEDHQKKIIVQSIFFI